MAYELSSLFQEHFVRLEASRPVLFDMGGYQSVLFSILPTQMAKADDSFRIWSRNAFRGPSQLLIEHKLRHVQADEVSCL